VTTLGNLPAEDLARGGRIYLVRPRRQRKATEQASLQDHVGGHWARGRAVYRRPEALASTSELRDLELTAKEIEEIGTWVRDQFPKSKRETRSDERAAESN
jgi:hypothetical protein